MRRRFCTVVPGTFSLAYQRVRRGETQGGKGRRQVVNLFEKVGRAIFGDRGSKAESAKLPDAEGLLRADEGVVTNQLQVLQERRDELGLADEYLRKHLPVARYGDLHRLVETLSNTVNTVAYDIRTQPDDIRRTDLTLHSFRLIVEQLQECAKLVRARAPEGTVDGALARATVGVRTGIQSFGRLTGELLHIDNEVAVEGKAGALEELGEDASPQ